MSRRRRAGAGGDGLPTADDVEQLSYTAQVVDEALRLYPPAHTLVRRASDHGELLGRQLPAGRIVAVSIWGIHRSLRVWPEAERFDPDRFGAEGQGHRERYAHLPFGGGPRACIGVHLAVAGLVVAVATVVRAYRLPSLQDAPALDVGVSLRPRGALPCRLQPVASSGPT